MKKGRETKKLKALNKKEEEKKSETSLIADLDEEKHASKEY